MLPGKGVPGSGFESHTGTCIFVQSRCGGWCSVTFLTQFLTFCPRYGMKVSHVFFQVRKPTHSRNEWFFSSAAKRRVQPIKDPLCGKVGRERGRIWMGNPLHSLDKGTESHLSGVENRQQVSPCQCHNLSSCSATSPCTSQGMTRTFLKKPGSFSRHWTRDLAWRDISHFSHEPPAHTMNFCNGNNSSTASRIIDFITVWENYSTWSRPCVQSVVSVGRGTRHFLGATPCLSSPPPPAHAVSFSHHLLSFSLLFFHSCPGIGAWKGLWFAETDCGNSCICNKEGIKNWES